MRRSIVHIRHRTPHIGIDKRGVANHITLAVDHQVIARQLLRKANRCRQMSRIIEQNDLQPHQITSKLKTEQNTLTICKLYSHKDLSASYQQVKSCPNRNVFHVSWCRCWINGTYQFPIDCFFYQTRYTSCQRFCHTKSLS